jgi:amino acid transporter
MYLVIALLIAIVILLCVPLKQRAGLLRVLVGIAVLALVIYYVGPIAVGFVVLSYQYVSEHLGWARTLEIIAGVAFLLSIFLLWKSDRRENEAIRAGSAEAFNRRVEAYKRDPFNYDHAKAVETTTRIKEGKQ